MIKAALQGYNSLYISINHKFPERRIKDFLNDVQINIIGEIVNKKIYIQEIFEFSAFQDFYININEYIFKNNIKVVFIDSIAALIETEFFDINGNLDFQKRENFLTRLKKIVFKVF